MMDMLNQISEDQKNYKFPQIMGILNITEDSFSDGGVFIDKAKAIDHAFEMISQGADIIDIGGESTRPGAIPVNTETEISRTIPIVEEIRKQNKDIIISIDTTKYDVAKSALSAGANIINDISGLAYEPRFVDLALEFNAELIIMHMQGTPGTMQKNPVYDNVVNDIYNFFEQKLNYLNSLSLKNVIIDVGIGFGKTLDHNLELLRNLDKFNSLPSKKMLGISRKSFIGKLFNLDKPEERDLQTLIFHSLLLKNNLDIIRVHNVKNFKFLKMTYDILHNNTKKYETIK
jgi:dihydropteroate synthase